MIISPSSNAYLNDILHQPDALRNSLLEFRKSNFEQIRKFGSGSFKSVVLTGMGSSYHALHPLFLVLNERGVNAQMIETSELIHFAPGLLSPESLVIAVSQSGQSAETIQLLELARKQIPILGITNTSGSPLAQQSQSALITQAGPEYSVSCKTYVTTLAALAILGDLLTDRDPAETISALENTVEAMTHYLSNWESHLQSALQEMDGVRYIVFAGRGPSLAAAGTGGLITKEAARFPAEGMSCAGFRHGPIEMISSAIFVLVFEGIGTARRLNTKLVDDIKSVGGQARLVAMDNNSHVYSIPAVPVICLPLMEILPVQLISVALALKNNQTPGQFRLARKTTIIE